VRESEGALAPLPRWLLIGNSRWHWAAPAAAPGEVLRVWHTPAGAVARDLGELGESLLGWAAVGAVPAGEVLPPARRLELGDVPLGGLPPWLGIDRALVGWAGWRRRGGALLVADAGTVLSLTRVDGAGRFAGGRLLAGVALQLRAMAAGTRHLGEALGPQGWVGKAPPRLWPEETAAAMGAGVMRGLAAAIAAAAAEAAEAALDAGTGTHTVLITGGDGPALAPLVASLLAGPIGGPGGLPIAVELVPELALEALAALRPLRPGPGR